MELWMVRLWSKYYLLKHSLHWVMNLLNLPLPPPLFCQAPLFWQTPLYKLRSCQAPPFWKFSRRFKGEGEGCALCQIRWKDFLKDYNFGSSSFYIYFYGWTLIPSLEVLFRFSIVFPVNWVRIISKVQIFWDRKIK